MMTQTDASRSDQQPAQASLRKRFRGLFGQRGQHGSMLIEVAVVLPVFVILLIGFCEYSLAFVSYMNATYAVRVAARYASLHSLSSDNPVQIADIRTMVQNNLFIPGGSYGPGNIIVAYGNRAGATPGVGNYQGDLVGVGFIWTQTINIPFVPTKTFYIESQAYRVIQR